MRDVILAAGALLVTACAGAPDISSVTRIATVTPDMSPIEIGVDGDAVALAFSGGGARAAAFAHGVLLGMTDMSASGGGALTDRIALVTAVSGGAITAAYFGLHGVDGLDGFRAAVLDKDWAGDLHSSLFAPANWARLLDGGLNGPDKLAEWLDGEVFSGARMRDMQAGPRIVINATDLYTSAPFAFTAPYFDAICSDLGEVRVADAVGASMAVPLAFRPVIAATNAGECPAPLPAWVGEAARDRSAPVMLRETARAFQLWRDPETAKFLHLADGGLADNFGLSTLITMRRASQTPYGPFSAQDAVRIRRLAFVVVNAEMAPAGDWALEAKGPSGIGMVEATLNVAVNAPKRLAYDAFGATLENWQRDLIDWRCSLTPDDARALGAGEGWACDDVSFRLDLASFRDLPREMAERLGAAPTQVSLPADLIDDLIAAGRTVALGNPLLQELTR